MSAYTSGSAKRLMFDDGTVQDVGTVANEMFVPLGYVDGAAMTYSSATAITLGTAALDSVVRDSTGVLTLKWNGTLSLDIAVTGAGGLQTSSSEAANTWYGAYLIGDTTLANTPEGLLIPDGTVFSETGYDVFRQVGWVRNDGASDLLKFFQFGSGHSRWIAYDHKRADIRVLDGGSAGGMTVVDCSAFMPPGAQEFQVGYYFKTGLSGSSTDKLELRITGSSIVNSPWSFKGTEVSGKKIHGSSIVFANASQSIDYSVSDGANNGASLHVLGYRYQI